MIIVPLSKDLNIQLGGKKCSGQVIIFKMFQDTKDLGNPYQ